GRLRGEVRRRGRGDPSRHRRPHPALRRGGGGGCPGGRRHRLHALPVLRRGARQRVARAAVRGGDPRPPGGLPRGGPRERRRHRGARSAAEARAGAPVAAVIVSTHSPFFDEALANEWLVPLSEAGIPDRPGDFPEEYLENDGATAIVSMVPTSLVYNTEAFDEAPDSWEVYADPAMNGRIQMADPDTSPANLAFWTLMQQEYGDEFLQAVAANEPT